MYSVEDEMKSVFFHHRNSAEHSSVTQINHYFTLFSYPPKIPFCKRKFLRNKLISFPLVLYENVIFNKQEKS